MKKRNTSKNSSMPMLELIIVIGLFAISSIFLLQMFLTANALEQKAGDKSHSVLAAENIAESIKADHDLEKTMNELHFLPEDEMRKNIKENPLGIDIKSSYLKFFDKDWNEIDGEENENIEKKGRYCAVVKPNKSISKAGNIIQVQVYLYRLAPYSFAGWQKNKNEEITELCCLEVADYDADSK